MAIRMALGDLTVKIAPFLLGKNVRDDPLFGPEIIGDPSCLEILGAFRELGFPGLLSEAVENPSSKHRFIAHVEFNIGCIKGNGLILYMPLTKKVYFLFLDGINNGVIGGISDGSINGLFHTGIVQGIGFGGGTAEHGINKGLRQGIYVDQGHHEWFIHTGGVRAECSRILFSGRILCRCIKPGC